MNRQATQFIVIVALAIGLLVFGYVALTAQKQDIPNELFCEQDTDCVPAQCCHPTSAVNKANAPDCSDRFCTQVCEPNTLDCGQGEVKCIKNRCTAIIK